MQPVPTLEEAPMRILFVHPNYHSGGAEIAATLDHLAAKTSYCEIRLLRQGQAFAIHLGLLVGLAEDRL